MDPAIAVATADGRTSSAPPGAPGGEDVFTAVRQRYWQAPSAADPLPDSVRICASGSLLADLLAAEYRAPEGDAGGSVRLGAEDRAVARLRAGMRAGRTPTPEEGVLGCAGSPLRRAAVAALWAGIAECHGAARAAAALHAGLLHEQKPEARALLLDLAAAHEPAVPALLPVREVIRDAHSEDRGLRHAAWRALAAHLPAVAAALRGVRAIDVYERLLLEALTPLPGAPLAAEQAAPGAVVVQSMLMGGLDTPGQGLSGGLGVLLGSLGDALVRTEQVAAVVTVVGACRAELVEDPVLIRRRGPGHWVVRLPVDSDRPLGPETMGLHREALAWWAVRLLGSLGRSVDVVHVRYADDGSLALAESARRLGASLVFTATPDPHRQITERHGIPGADPDALRLDLHRVFLADCLVDRADRVVALAGRGGGTNELLRHFPQLPSGSAGPLAVPEGIGPYDPAGNEKARRRSLLRRVGVRPAPVAAGEGTLLLSVGRLHPVKQQDLLVRAWLESGSHEDSRLVLIGGSPGADDPVEQRMRDRIEESLASCPGARSRIQLLPAWSNAEVRCLERALADPATGVRARYVCPSAKEEFGLAVLEAMESGLAVAAPARGGIPTYLVDGVNGLLLDTSTSRSLGAGLRRLLALDEPAARAIGGRARKLVRDAYSVERMARTLADDYRALAADRRGRPARGARPR
ncbi:glycosyltransferase family 4 protein [Streptomyces sp. NPDC059442]|uniref:glycosyltransferase family 4 protein n=1 Tax=Streptomyces sp. NPDC059442 TaxID=3346830 RepID=UPI0036A93654